MNPEVTVKVSFGSEGAAVDEATTGPPHPAPLGGSSTLSAGNPPSPEAVAQPGPPLGAPTLPRPAGAMPTSRPPAPLPLDQLEAQASNEAPKSSKKRNTRKKS